MSKRLVPQLEKAKVEIVSQTKEQDLSIEQEIVPPDDLIEQKMPSRGFALHQHSSFLVSDMFYSSNEVATKE
jgi:hypothetical protein